MNESKIVSFTDQVRYRRLGQQPSMRERIEQFFFPAKRKLDSYLVGIGGLLAATYPYYGGVSGNSSNTGFVNNPPALSVAEIVLDFAAIAAARAAAGQAALGAADVLQLIGLPAGVWVPAVALDVTVAEGAACTIDVGDGADTDGFINDADANVVGWSSSLITTAYSLAAAGGKIYTAADTVDLITNSAATDVAKMRLLALLVDLRASRE